MMMMGERSKVLWRFRWVALAEAVSYVLLLAVAMPMKYVWGEPMAVRIVGSIHGGLFVAYCWYLAGAWRLGPWPLLRVLGLFVAALIPLLPFWLDARVKRWAQSH